MSRQSQYSQEYRERVAQEAITSKDIKATALKYELPRSRLYGWVRSFKNKDIYAEQKALRQYKKALEDRELQIKALKALLKKTTLTLVED